MSRYYQKPEKTRREKIGFYTAFSICLIAVCMAVYSTYTTVRQPKRQTAASVTPTSAVSVAQPMTGVTVPAATEPPETEPEVSAAPDTTAAAETTAATEPTGETRRADALQTMLAAEISLTMPTKSGRVVKPYSSDSVYNKTLNSWKPHTGADFDGELGDELLRLLGDGVILRAMERLLDDVPESLGDESLRLADKDVVVRIGVAHHLGAAGRHRVYVCEDFLLRTCQRGGAAREEVD